MLSAMRSGQYKYFFYALLGLLAIGLIGVGSGGVGSGNVRSIGKVGDQNIPVTTYAQTLQSTLQNAASRLGRPLSQNEIEQFGLQRSVLNAVIQTAALDNEANRLGVSVGDDAVAEAIRTTPAYQSITGEFDAEAYEFALERANVSAKDNEKSIRESAARSLLEGAVLSGASVPDSHANLFATFANETRDFEWVALTVGDFTDDPGTPNDQQLQTFYDENTDTYTIPETKNITYALLRPDMLTDDIEIGDDILRQDFEAQKNRFNQPERRIVDRIIFSDAEQAADARARLDAQTVTYDELIAERGLEVSDVDLGDIERDELAANAADLVFGQSEPGVFGPIDSDLGPALFRVNAVLDAQNTSFEQARDDLRQEAIQEEASQMLRDLVETLEDKLAAGDSIEVLAEDTNMALNKIAFNADSEDEIARYAEFRTAATETKKGDFEEVRDLSDGSIFVLRVDDVIPPTAQPLDDIRDTVVTDWTQTQKETALADRTAKLVADLNTGRALGDAGYSATRTKGQTRGDTVSGLPNDAKIELYDLEVGSGASKEINGVTYVMQLTAITPPDLDSPETTALVDTLKQQLSVQTSADILTLFSNALQADAGVELNQAAINSLNSQIGQF